MAKNIFFEFTNFPCPPFFSTRYLINCLYVAPFGRRETSETVAGVAWAWSTLD